MRFSPLLGSLYTSECCLSTNDAVGQEPIYNFLKNSRLPQALLPPAVLQRSQLSHNAICIVIIHYSFGCPAGRVVNSYISVRNGFVENNRHQLMGKLQEVHPVTRWSIGIPSFIFRLARISAVWLGPLVPAPCSRVSGPQDLLSRPKWCIILTRVLSDPLIILFPPPPNKLNTLFCLMNIQSK